MLSIGVNTALAIYCSLIPFCLFVFFVAWRMCGDHIKYRGRGEGFFSVFDRRGGGFFAKAMSSRMTQRVVSDDAQIEQRARQIRIRAKLSSFARVAFIPAVTLYSLFMTRPREGHFHKFIAERRFYDPLFEAQFHQSVSEGPKPRADSTKSGKSKKETDRELRRSVMFRREINFAEEGEEKIASAVDLNELRKERELAERHLTMPEIMSELRLLSTSAATSRRDQPHVVLNGGAASQVFSVSFQEHLFWSRGELHLTGGGSMPPYSRTFIGILGMMWWELPS